MFGDKPIQYTLIANGAIVYGTVVAQSGTSGRERLGFLPTAATQALVGIAMQDANSGDQVGVCGVGLARCVAGAAVSQNARVTTNSSGRVVGTTTSGDTVIGTAREAALANGDTFECLINVSGDRA